MRRLNIVGIVCIWLATAVLLYWLRGLPFRMVEVPILSDLLGAKFKLYGLAFPLLFVPLLLTFLRFGIADRSAAAPVVVGARRTVACESCGADGAIWLGAGFLCVECASGDGES